VVITFKIPPENIVDGISESSLNSTCKSTPINTNNLACIEKKTLENDIQNALNFTLDLEFKDDLNSKDNRQENLSEKEKISKVSNNPETSEILDGSDKNTFIGVIFIYIILKTLSN